MTTYRIPFTPKTQYKGGVFTHQNARERVYICHALELQEKVCHFPRNCKRKGTVSETALAQPGTKIRQVPPSGFKIRPITVYRLSIASLLNPFVHPFF